MVSDFAVAQCGQVIMETRIMKLPLKACNQYSRGENLPLAKVSQLGVNIELWRLHRCSAVVPGAWRPYSLAQLRPIARQIGLLDGCFWHSMFLVDRHGS
jgi:hypothetical protein